MDRERVLANDFILENQPVDLRRLVITSDAGIGKTTAVEWLAYRCHFSDMRRNAFNVPLRELRGTTAGVDDRLLDYLASEVYRAARERGCTLEIARHAVDALRRRGRLVLLFEGLD